MTMQIAGLLCNGDNLPTGLRITPRTNILKMTPSLIQVAVAAPVVPFLVDTIKKVPLPLSLPVEQVDKDLKRMELGTYVLSDVHELMTNKQLTLVADSNQDPKQITSILKDVWMEKWNIHVVLCNAVQLKGITNDLFVERGIVHNPPMSNEVQEWCGPVPFLFVLVHENHQPSPSEMMSIRTACMQNAMPLLVVYGWYQPCTFGAGLSCILIRNTDGCTTRVHFTQPESIVMLQLGEVASSLEDVL